MRRKVDSRILGPPEERVENLFPSDQRRSAVAWLDLPTLGTFHGAHVNPAH